VIHYTKEDFTARGETYDIIFDTVCKTSHSGSLKVLKQGGSYLQAAAGPAEIIRMKRAARRTGTVLVSETATPTTDLLMELRSLVDAGKLRAVIDRCYPLEQMVEAHRHVDQGHKKGNVVVTVRDTGRR